MNNIVNTILEESAELLQQGKRIQSEIPIANGRRTRLQDYPLFMTVRDVAEMTGLRTAACYTLLHIEGCPVYRVEGQAKYMIPRDAFYDFLIQSSLKPKEREDLPYLPS